MNDQLPDFEATVPPVVDYPKPKKPRRKPARRKAAPVVDRGAAIRFGKAKAKKRKAVAKRRGRPAGSPNKPKLAILGPSPVVSGQAQAVLVLLEVLAKYSSEVRKEILDRARALA